VTTADQTDQGITEDQRRWQAGVASLISYRYLGTFSKVRGRDEAEGWVRVRSDMRGPVGLLAAPLGVALLDTAGINVDPLAVVSPTRIDVEIFETAGGVNVIHLEGRILRAGRSQFFTEGLLTDDDDRSRVIAIGATHWAVSGPNPGFRYVDNRPGVPESPDLPPLYEPFGARVREDGSFEIPVLTPELGRNGLHQGPFQVVPEAAAMAAAREAIGTDQFWIEHQGTSIISRGVGAPLVTSSELVRRTDESVTVRVELRAEGKDDNLCSVTVCRFRLG
jgi:acyl-coenzyme A thioesterase PaaI-like protein